MLEEKGDLRRIEASVSRDLEMSEIADRVVKSGGPALYFENVEGFDTASGHEPVRRRATGRLGARRREAG